MVSHTLILFSDWLRVDLQRQGLDCLELPGWGQGFQLYITRVPGNSLLSLVNPDHVTLILSSHWPGRSIVLFERFEMRTKETEVNIITQV